MEAGHPNKTILIVEDNEATAEIIREVLNDEPGYRAVAVHDGAHAIKFIEGIKIGAILLDIMLPGMSGLELYDLLQANPRTRRIPVIFVTAAPDYAELKKRSVRYVVSKPFALDDLVSSVNRVLRPN